MRKLICIILSTILILALSGLAVAASDAPEITLQPQSAAFPEYSVASYTVKASGSNLTATWYLEWQGATYNLSDSTNSIEPWEGFAGETYGGVQEDANTFVYFFGGVGQELSGAQIWCVIEDGHYDVASQKARVTIGGSAMPPVIEQIPAQLTVEQGGDGELRCIALAPGDTQLSFLWYETDTGRMEDMRAVNRGEETSDFLICDTSQVGTRYYLCMVQTTDGGTTYSSVVPVTVTEKETVPEAPTEPATEPAPTAEPTAAPNTQPEATKAAAQATPDPEPEGGPVMELPWWVLLLIALAGIGAGVGTAVILVRKNEK